MKLIVAIVQDTDAPGLTKALLERGLQSTKLASTGGFLREGNTTLLIGLEDERVPEVLDLIHEKVPHPNPPGHPGLPPIGSPRPLLGPAGGGAGGRGRGLRPTGGGVL